MGAGPSAGRCRRFDGIVAVLIAILLALGFAVPAVASAESSDQAVAYQLDAGHDGYQSGDPITAPLSQIWSITLPGLISYPLIANGVVYVTEGGGSIVSYGTTLYAIEQATGATLWSHALGGVYYWSGIAYDDGRVFALNQNGTLTAFDGTTGATDWSRSLPGQYDFTSAPTAVNGYVYTGGAGTGGTLYAVSEASGNVAWTASVENGDDSSPAVDANGVYVTYTGPQDYAFNPRTGAPLWHDDSGSEGGGGKTPVLADGDVFSRTINNNDLILSATTGASVGSFGSPFAPAVGGGFAYMASGGALDAVGGSGLGSPAWTFNGDNELDTAPLVVSGLVFEGSSNGNVYAINASTGVSEWSANAGMAILAPDGSSGPPTGLAAGEGTLIVPAGNTLVAYAGANVGSGSPTNTSAPTVTGTPEVGMQIAADVGTWTALPTGYAYQWLRCDAAGGSCANISGATADVYTPVTGDDGSTLEVGITATNATGTSGTVTSAPSNVVVAVPANVALPTIAGSATQGQSLNASSGSWTGSPTSYTYQWLRCTSGSCTPETGATSSTYVVARTDAGSQIEVEVTAVNAVGSSAAAISAPTVAIPVVGTTTTLAASQNPAPTGAVVTLTATISPSVDGGTVTFSQAGTPIVGCAGLPAAGATGSVTCTGTTFGQGDDALTAAYSGDGAYAGSSGGLTLVINPIAAPAAPAAAAPVAVTITGNPSNTSPTSTITYAETGSVSSTTCTIDGQATPCNDSEAIISGLGAGQHTFVVAIAGPGSDASANVTWTITSPVASSSGVLGAPADLRVHTTKHAAKLTWAPSAAASAYRLSVTISKRTRVYRLAASRHSYTITLGPRQHAVVRLRAIAANGAAGVAATVTVR